MYSRVVPVVPVEWMALPNIKGFATALPLEVLCGFHF
jgi:hypothetical protein